jgi:hypothetical protein
MTEKYNLKRIYLEIWIRRILDFGFTWIPISFAILWLGQAVWTICTTGDWFGGTTLFLFGSIHTVTVFAVCPLYLILFFFFNHERNLPIPVRVVTAVTIVAVGVFLNGVIWSTLNLLIGSHTGMPQIAVAFFFIICVILFALHRIYHVVQIHYRFMLIVTGIFLISLVLFVDSGFFYRWALFEAGLVPNPHNWQWAIEKTIAVYMWIGIVRR